MRVGRRTAGLLMIIVVLAGCGAQPSPSAGSPAPSRMPGATPGTSEQGPSEGARRAVAMERYLAAAQAYLRVNHDLAVRIRSVTTPPEQRDVYETLAGARDLFVTALRAIDFPPDTEPDVASLIELLTQEASRERSAADPAARGSLLQQAAATWDHTPAAVAVVALDLGVANLPLETPARNAAPSATLLVKDARSYGATGDGHTDDTAAIQAAVDAAAADKSAVLLRIGTYAVSQVNLPSNATLIGESRTGAVIQASGHSNSTLDYSDCVVCSRSATRVTIQNLTVRGRGAPGPTETEILIGLEGVGRVILRGVTLDRAAGRALFATGPGSVQGIYDDLLITRTHYARVQRVYNERLRQVVATPPYGTGVFLYDGYSDNQVSYLTTDTTSATALYFDGGSSIGGYAYNERNSFSQIHIYRANQVAPAWPAILVKGARGNTFERMRVSDSEVNETNALNVVRQQQGLYTIDNSFSNLVVKDVGGGLINLQSASSNTFRDIEAYNIAQVYESPLINVGWTSMNGDVSGGSSDDNAFERIRLVRQDGRDDYTTGVLFNTTQEPMRGNRFLAMGWGQPSESVVRVIGEHGAPLVGPEANVYEGVGIVACRLDQGQTRSCAADAFHATRSTLQGSTVTLSVTVVNHATTATPPLTVSLFGDRGSFGVFPPDFLDVSACSGCRYETLYHDGAYAFTWGALAPAETRQLVVTLRASGSPGVYYWTLGLSTGRIAGSDTADAPATGQYRIASWTGQTTIEAR